MASISLPPVTTGSSQLYIQKTAAIMASAFEHDPLERYVTLATDNLPNTTVIPLERHLHHFSTTIKEKVQAGVIISEAGDWGAAALWYPPGVETVFRDTGVLVQPILDLYDAFAVVKKRWLRGRGYWYLNLVARHPGRHQRGLVRALIEPYLKKASDEGVPAWLEATTVKSRDVYAHLGFQEVEQIQVGAGKADAIGNLKEGGEGLTIYCMIAEPNM